MKRIEMPELKLLPLQEKITQRMIFKMEMDLVKLQFLLWQKYWAIKKFNVQIWWYKQLLFIEHLKYTRNNRKNKTGGWS